MAAYRPPWLPPSSEASTTEPELLYGTGGAPAVAPPANSVVDESDERPRAGVVQDPATGRFIKGSGGRPKGSKNRVTVAIENMLEGEGERIARKTIELALAGDPACIKLVMERIAPVRKGRALPSIEVKKGEGKIQGILRAMLDGAITPEEGQTAIGVLESAARIEVARALEEQRRMQLEALKRVQDEGGSGRGHGPPTHRAGLHSEVRAWFREQAKKPDGLATIKAAMVTDDAAAEVMWHSPTSLLGFTPELHSRLRLEVLESRRPDLFGKFTKSADLDKVVSKFDATIAKIPNAIGQTEQCSLESRLLEHPDDVANARVDGSP